MWVVLIPVDGVLLLEVGAVLGLFGLLGEDLDVVGLLDGLEVAEVLLIIDLLVHLCILFSNIRVIKFRGLFRLLRRSWARVRRLLSRRVL